MAGTTTDKLERLMQTKADIKSALIEIGQAPGDVFSEYANMIRAGGGGGGGSIFKTSANGNIPVYDSCRATIVLAMAGMFKTSASGSPA